MRKIVTIVGARPQFVKAAALSREILKHQNLEEVIVHTGQHFDEKMSDIFFEEMSIPKPKYNLEINSMGHGAMTGKMLEGIEQILLDEKPDMVLVYGDTNSTIAGALAAKKLHIKVGHVEAGLRSFNIKMPEEVNRILTDRISDVLLCPTDTAIKNLEQEGYNNLDTSVVKSGDIMQDAAMFYAQSSQEKSSVINDEQLEKESFVLCTLHRAENTDSEDRLASIVNALNEVHKQKPVVLPLHPRTAKMLEKFNLDLQVKVIEPVGYFDMIELLKNCACVATDSGGLQKEAFFFKKECITMRDETEWVELVEQGFNTLVGANYDKIIQAINQAGQQDKNFEVNLYGNGLAAKAIVEAIQNTME